MTARYPDDFYRRIVDLQASGAMTQPEIAKVYGATTTSVARWMREARRRGIAPPSLGRGSGIRSKPRCPNCGAPPYRQGRAS